MLHLFWGLLLKGMSSPIQMMTLQSLPPTEPPSLPFSGSPVELTVHAFTGYGLPALGNDDHEK